MALAFVCGAIRRALMHGAGVCLWCYRQALMHGAGLYLVALRHGLVHGASAGTQASAHDTHQEQQESDHPCCASFFLPPKVVFLPTWMGMHQATQL